MEAVAVITPVVAEVTLDAVNAAIVLPVPLAAKPIAVLLFVQLTADTEGLTENDRLGTVAPAQADLELIAVMVGVELIVTVNVPCDEAGLTQPAADVPITV